MHVLPRCTALALLLAACAGEPPTDTLATGQPVLPDTQTVAGVLQMRHDSTAFARAPRLRLAAEPTVVFSDGGDPDFDLSRAEVTLLADGRLVAVDHLGGGELAAVYNLGGGRLMTFHADGTPDRVLATSGQGPGELSSPTAAYWLGGDTVVVLDDGTKRASWFSVEGGLLRSERVPSTAPISCHRPVGALRDGRYLAVGRCGRESADPAATGGGQMVPLLAAPLDYARIDTLAMVAGTQMGEAEVPGGGAASRVERRVRLGRFPVVAVWGGDPVTGATERGYVIERRDAAGRVVAEIVVDGVARPVTTAMRDTIVARAMAIADGPRTPGSGNPEAMRHFARADPINDTLPAFQQLIAGADGLLWAVDYVSPIDSGWSATAFDQGGAIVGRLESRVPGRPVAFTERGVLVRETDEDGVVRFGVYDIVWEGE